MTDFDSLKKYVEKSTDIADKIHQYGIYYRFFPSLKDAKEMYQIDQKKQENDMLNENEFRDNLIDKYYHLSKLETGCNVTEIHLTNHNITNKAINLQRLFDVVPLSDDIPFCKVKDEELKINHYKIFKPSIINELVNKKLLDCWIKGRDNCFTKRNSNTNFKLTGLCSGE